MLQLILATPKVTLISIPDPFSFHFLIDQKHSILNMAISTKNEVE